MAHDLDDLSFVTRLDPKGMYSLTCDFADQCRRAFKIANQVNLPDIQYPTVAVLTGLGGSAAGGDFTKALFDVEGKVPFLVNRDYHLPSWVDSRSLVFCASYSGNTEETLSSYADAKRAGAQIVVISSGGKISEMAAADGFPVISIPGGQPPRTALGYMLIPTVVTCMRFDLIPVRPFEEIFAGLDEAIQSWSVNVPFESNPAKQLAEFLHGKLSVIYGLGGWQAIVANRWKGQINENGKNMTFANGFPELNHNEILGWVECQGQGVENWVGLILEDGKESKKMRARADISTQLIGDRGEFRRVGARGDGVFEKMLNLTLLGDFVSLYLAALNGVDPENIDWLNTLKSELAKID